MQGAASVDLASLPPFAAIFTNDRIAPAPPCGRRAPLWVSDVTKSRFCMAIDKSQGLRPATWRR
ncbi:hypothetical protein GCM10007928_19320 [Sulfitobacter porphyrae]|nr:hypothetical protein GCM10007928_19320 [Sulfitobacter porphyrae]